MIEIFSESTSETQQFHRFIRKHKRLTGTSNDGARGCAVDVASVGLVDADFNLGPALVVRGARSGNGTISLGPASRAIAFSD